MYTPFPKITFVMLTGWSEPWYKEIASGMGFTPESRLLFSASNRFVLGKIVSIADYSSILLQLFWIVKYSWSIYASDICHYFGVSMSFAEILNKLMREHNTSNLALSKVVGISDTAVGKWRKGESLPALDNAVSIAKYFGVTLDELAENKTSDPLFYLRLPVIGRVSKWGVYKSRFWAEGYITVSNKDLHGYAREECFALKVNDSSIPDTYPDLSYIIFHHQKQCADGDNVILRMNKTDEFIYKKFNWVGENIELTAPDVRTISIPKQEINNVILYGVQIETFDDV